MEIKYFESERKFDITHFFKVTYLIPLIMSAAFSFIGISFAYNGLNTLTTDEAFAFLVIGTFVSIVGIIMLSIFLVFVPMHYYKAIQTGNRVIIKIAPNNNSHSFNTKFKIQEELIERNVFVSKKQYDLCKHYETIPVFLYKKEVYPDWYSIKEFDKRIPKNKENEKDGK